MEQSKSQPITRRMMWEAWKQVKANRGSAGIDGLMIHHFEENQKGRLYKIWNRLASGSYFPPPVKEVSIPKKTGGTRKLGIPTVGDRIAQAVVRNYLEPAVDVVFHPNSYGYRPGRSAHDALEAARRNCWKYDWVIDLDIKGFFDNLDHELLMRAVRKHTEEKWVLMYIQRWLKALIQTECGELVKRAKGTPQGGVASPLLANIFLHHAFDAWMSERFPDIEFERYADDVIVHCKTRNQAEFILDKIRRRLKRCKLDLHPAKTRIVCCRDDKRRGPKQEHEQFTFLGYTFQPRSSRGKDGLLFVGFNPAISRQAKSEFGYRIKKLDIQLHTGSKIEEIAVVVNRIVRGYVNYFGRFRRFELFPMLRNLNIRLINWACRKFKRFRYRKRRAVRWLKRACAFQPELFVHWKLGVRP